MAPWRSSEILISYIWLSLGDLSCLGPTALSKPVIALCLVLIPWAQARGRSAENVKSQLHDSLLAWRRSVGVHGRRSSIGRRERL